MSWHILFCRNCIFTLIVDIFLINPIPRVFIKFILLNSFCKDLPVVSLTNLIAALSPSVHSPCDSGQVYLCLLYCSVLAGVLKPNIKNRRNSFFKIIFYINFNYPVNMTNITPQTIGFTWISRRKIYVIISSDPLI